jgi:hypothetical protein
LFADLHSGAEQCCGADSIIPPHYITANCHCTKPVVFDHVSMFTGYEAHWTVIMPASKRSVTDHHAAQGNA